MAAFVISWRLFFKWLTGGLYGFIKWLAKNKWFQKWQETLVFWLGSAHDHFSREPSLLFCCGEICKDRNSMFSAQSSGKVLYCGKNGLSFDKY
jgi:hypothetical protein